MGNTQTVSDTFRKKVIKLFINLISICVTLNSEDTTEEARKKLCTCLFDNVKGKINQVSLSFI